MTIDETRQVLESYLGGHGSEVLAENAVFTDVSSGAEHKGRDAIMQMLRSLYSEAFDASAEETSVVIGEGKAVVEFEFTGTHVGEFAGIDGTGTRVQVPFAVAYDFEADQIVGARIYFPTERLLQQLRA